MIPLPPDAALEPLVPAMAVDLFRLVDRNRAHLTPFLPWVPMTKTSADTLAFIEGELAKQGEGRSFPFGLYQHGRLKGVAHIFVPRENLEHGEIGYWLAEDAQGQGLMTRASEALIKLGLKDLGMTRVRIRCHIKNKRSRGVPERLGLTYIGREMGDRGGLEGWELDVFEARSQDVAP